jgi:hypothetical protein
VSDESATFLCVIPSTVTAIRIHGDEGMRLTLDVDESNLPAALDLLRWRGRLLKVTVEPAD